MNKEEKFFHDVEATNFRGEATNFRGEATNFRGKATNFRGEATNFREEANNSSLGSLLARYLISKYLN